MEYQDKNSAAFGGYFGIELPEYAFAFKTALGFQSARAALRFWLQNSDIKTLHVPMFICDSIIRAVEDANVDIKFYNLTDELLPRINSYSEDKHTGYMLVNYFGLRSRELNNLQETEPRTNFLFDNSQAFFAAPFSTGATIYSPRKFFGLPDGGFLDVNDKRFRQEYSQLEQDDESILRMGHLLKRSSVGARGGYPDFVNAELSLEDTQPRKISELTVRLIRSVNTSSARSNRQINFDFLNDVFGATNLFPCSREEEDVPICYPLMLDHNAGEIKAKLADEDIFCPTYWPEVLERSSEGSWEFALVNNMLHLPCDQRYSLEGMKRMAKTVSEALKNEQ